MTVTIIAGWGMFALGFVYGWLVACTRELRTQAAQAHRDRVLADRQAQDADLLAAEALAWLEQQ